MTASAASPVRSALRAGLALMLLVVAVPMGLVATALPAQACDCAMGSPQQRLDWAEAVFVGDVVAREGRGVHYTETGLPFGGAFIYTVAVDRVFKGEVAPMQEVVATTDGAACGIVLPDHGSVIIYGSAGKAGPAGPGKIQRGQYATWLCSGSGKASAAPAVYGEGWSPVQEAPAPGTPDPAVIDYASPASEQYGPVIAGGVVLVLLCGLGYAVWRRRRI